MPFAANIASRLTLLALYWYLQRFEQLKYYMHQGRTSSHLSLVEFLPFPFALDVLGHRSLSCSTEQLAQSCLGLFVGLLILGISNAATAPGPGYLDVIFPHRVIRHLPVSWVVRIILEQH